ncbi:Glycerol uptake protein [Lachnellula subtilissima]|uniref:Glycerol uptake protein n=1 Tax=Lachnellula subtilissima TaxID=602034 RepID=A0A8H8RP21_9HELO|nr:Glycerol uptake protein [Lachnellula subtilissima]
MSIFSYIRSIYALDTIDTRFTSSSSTPYKAVIDARLNTAASTSKRDDSVLSAGVKTDRHGRPVAQPSKWNTPEFYLYYFVFLTIVPYMFWIAYDVSRPSDPNYQKFEPWLSPGWVPGRKIDLSDAQYSSFRRNLPYLAILVTFHPLLRKVYNALRPLPIRSNSPRPNGKSTYISAAEADDRLEQRASFDFGWAFIFLAALHGFSALKILSILFINYSLVTRLPRKYVPAATWVFNICTLFANELSDGFKFGKMATYFSPIEYGGAHSGSLLHAWAAWLDSHGGILPRWHVLFNLTVLRLISYDLDYYWSLDARGGSLIEKKQLDPANLSERDRVSIPAPTKEFNFRNYVAYTIYAPLYLTGPILTFNDYISQLKYPPASIETARTIRYGLRFLLVLLAMELVLHFDYCVAISKANPNWNDYTPAQLSLLSYFNLHILWLKLLIPWRFHRLWSLIDGIDPPENMLRCLSDNPSTIAFWRSWHKSYNRWLIRYIYIPMGGADSSTWISTIRSFVNYLTVFTFVALWHDIKLNLLIWGWLIVLFMLPEAIAGYVFPPRKWEDRKTAYRVICGIGAVGNLMMMMIANLVGFAVGVDGLKRIISGIFKDFSGMTFLVTASSVLFVGIQVMFEVRQGEARKGIYLRC